MDARSIGGAGGPKDPVGRARQKAEQAAAQFEQLFVRSMVSSLRSTSTLGGEGGMFGSGPGSDTFADWFDQNLGEQIARTANVGIKRQLLADLERHGEIPRASRPPAGNDTAAATTPVAPHELTTRLRAALAAADRTTFHATRPAGAAGVDVLSR